MSDWSIKKVSPRNDSKDDGRVSLYFKSKSKELGKLSGEDGPRVRKIFLFDYFHAKCFLVFPSFFSEYCYMNIMLKILVVPFNLDFK